MDNVWQLLGAIAGTGVITTVIGALLNRRKTSADTIEVIDRAASSAVKRSEEDNTRLRAELGKARDGEERLWVKTRSLEHENAALIDVLRDQIAYSRQLAGVVRALGGDVPDPPELPAELLR